MDELRLTPALPVEPLDELLAEARRYAGYLAKLEARREGTPAHLFTRLHDEYRTRLEALRERAEAEAKAIAEGFAAEESALRDAEHRLAEAHEAHAEGELRAAVGELQPAVWEERRVTLTAQIAAIGAERDARAAALTHRRALLAEVGRERGGGMNPGAVRERKRALGSAAPRPAEAPPHAPAPPAPPAPSSASSRPRTPPSPEPAVPDPTERLEPATSAPADGKSLRCHGCGMMNFPSEWYCERCGGELAAA